MSYLVDETGQEWREDGIGWYCINTGETIDDNEFRCKRLINPQIVAAERSQDAHKRSTPAGRSKGDSYIPASGASYRQQIDTNGVSHRKYGGSSSRKNRATRGKEPS